MDNTNNDNIPENNNKPVKHLRCINIDCVFNSSNQPEHERNTCNHPNLKVESKFADITIAICSEFRSKKDYSFELPTKLVDLKTRAEIEIVGKPDPAFTHIEKVTTEELESSIKNTAENDKDLAEYAVIKNDGIPQVVEYEKPVIIQTTDEKTLVTEPYLTTDKNHSDLQILKRLYQPYLRRGIIVSIIAHLAAIWVLFLFTSEGEDKTDPSQQQRIVVVEDIETPKIEPPVVRLPGDEPKNDAGDVTENNADVRPKITPKTVKPRIIRPKINTEDTTNISNNNINDSLRHVTDSLLALKLNDTTKLSLADSLKNFMPQNEIGLTLWWPKNWKMTDNRSLNLELDQFKGVIINTDSLSEDPGAVNIFVQMDDPKHTNFNKTTFKNTFAMDDTTATGFSTDPTVTGSKRITYKFFVFTDPTGLKNMYVNTETKKDLFDKYKPYIEAIVRSIKIVKAPPPGTESGK